MEWIKKSEIFVPSQELELPKKHHSLADWDFRAGEVYALDNAVYTSAPSSLRITGPGGENNFTTCLNRDASCLNLPQGRLETQFRVGDFTNEGNPQISFRNQGALNSIDDDNTYYIRIGANTNTLYKRVAATETNLGTWTRTHYNLTWYRERITWWNEAPVLLIRYEYWDGSAWVIVTPDITDSSPDFGDSSTNRCGLGFYIRAPSNNRNFWYDDTMIYGPA